MGIGSFGWMVEQTDRTDGGIEEWTETMEERTDMIHTVSIYG